MQFSKPPLVELVAELKWLPVAQGPMPSTSQMVPQPILATTAQEEFFSAFVRESARSGWNASERIVPLNFPLVSQQPALRIRSFSDNEAQMLYQVGPGIFSAHALPPYKNWESFRPFVARGLKCLLKTRAPGEKNQEFFSISLRYLDLFTPEFIGNMPVSEFLTKILGFTLELPAVLQRQVRQGESALPQISIQIPLSSGAQLTLTVGGGAIVGDKTGILMHTDVSNRNGIPATEDDVFAVWDDAHKAIRETFVGLTPALYSVMQPIEG